MDLLTLHHVMLRAKYYMYHWGLYKVIVVDITHLLKRHYLNHLTPTKYAFGLKWKITIILLFSLFLLLFMGSTMLFGTIMGSTVLFQLTFTFIYNTFSNNFLISAKSAVSKYTSNIMWNDTRNHTIKSRLDICFYWVEKFGSFCTILGSYKQENKKK